MLVYDHLIGEEYERKRKAYLAYIGCDVVRTPKLLDLAAELDLFNDYQEWDFVHCYRSNAERCDPEVVAFAIL